MASFKEVKGMVPAKEQPKKSEPAAASKILASHATKDKRMSIRINSTTYEQFDQINTKLGTSNSSVVNMMIAEYIMKYKDLLEV